MCIHSSCVGVRGTTFVSMFHLVELEERTQFTMLTPVDFTYWAIFPTVRTCSCMNGKIVLSSPSPFTILYLLPHTGPSPQISPSRFLFKVERKHAILGNLQFFLLTEYYYIVYVCDISIHLSMSFQCFEEFLFPWWLDWCVFFSFSCILCAFLMMATLSVAKRTLQFMCTFSVWLIITACCHLVIRSVFSVLLFIS